MACDLVEGNWEEGRLVDDTGDVLFDPILHLGPPDGSGEFEGAFDGEDSFRGRCFNGGRQPTIVFTRLHSDGVTITIYRGKFSRIEAQQKDILRGRFTRINVSALRDVATLRASTGDWETEKPT